MKRVFMLFVLVVLLLDHDKCGLARVERIVVIVEPFALSNIDGEFGRSPKWALKKIGPRTSE